MERGRRKLQLVIPGLFGPFASSTGTPPRPRAGTLERLLSRGKVRPFPGTDFSSTLFQLFGIEQQLGQDLPSAPLCRLAQGGGIDRQCVMHADPVYLRPDQDRLLLFDSDQLSVSKRDAAELTALFNRHFKDDGLQLEPVSADRWYLHLPEQPVLHTHALEDVVGRNIDLFLPRGEQARQWRQILNEVQMLFHGAAANERREQAGLPPINSLWFWGAGHMPEGTKASYASVSGAHPLLQGLAMQAGVKNFSSLTDNLAIPRQAGDHLVVWDQIWRSVIDADAQGWSEAVESLEHFMTSPAAAVKRGTIDLLEIYPCNGEKYQVSQKILRRFWLRSKPLLERLQADINRGDLLS